MGFPDDSVGKKFAMKETQEMQIQSLAILKWNLPIHDHRMPFRLFKSLMSFNSAFWFLINKFCTSFVIYIYITINATVNGIVSIFGLFIASA